MRYVGFHGDNLTAKENDNRQANKDETFGKTRRDYRGNVDLVHALVNPVQILVRAARRFARINSSSRQQRSNKSPISSLFSAPASTDSSLHFNHLHHPGQKSVFSSELPPRPVLQRRPRLFV